MCAHLQTVAFLFYWVIDLPGFKLKSSLCYATADIPVLISWFVVPTVSQAHILYNFIVIQGFEQTLY